MGGRLDVRAVLATVLAALVVATPAQAAFPGVNGRIAYAPSDIHTIDPSGLARVRVTDDCCNTGEPAFSPDGRRIAFISGEFAGGVETIDQYGGDRRAVRNVTTSVRHVAWSPDGSKMVASILNCDVAPGCPTDLFVVGTDGNGLTNITNTASSENHPKWSPDGSKIAFDSLRGGEQDIFVVHPDGTGEVNLTAADPEPVLRPDWSPNGSKVAYLRGGTQTGRPFTMNADGTGEAAVAGTTTDSWAVTWSPDGTQLAFVGNFHEIYRVPSAGGARVRITCCADPGLDWQPLAEAPTPPPTGSGYPRPRGAKPFRIPLVVAYWHCPRQGVAANRQHAPPLAYPSCSPPVRKSGLELGTPDFNGLPAEGIGFVRIAPVLGDPTTPADEADVRITVSQEDVWLKKSGVLVNYAGRLKARIDLRITDKFNAGGPDASGTVMDFPLTFRFQCATTPDDPAGGKCAVTTTAEALSPGMISEGRRTIWELGEIDVRFEGTEGNPNDLSSDQIFLRSGVFVP